MAIEKNIALTEIAKMFATRLIVESLGETKDD